MKWINCVAQDTLVYGQLTVEFKTSINRSLGRAKFLFRIKWRAKFMHWNANNASAVYACYIKR